MIKKTIYGKTWENTEEPFGYIYLIRNFVTGKLYIGQTTSIDKRWEAHMEGIKNLSHPNGDISLDSFLFGSGTFQFFILEFLEDKNIDIFKTEQNFIKLFCSEYPEGYNLNDRRESSQKRLENLLRAGYEAFYKIRDERKSDFKFLNNRYMDIMRRDNKEISWIFNKLIEYKSGTIKEKYNNGKNIIKNILKNMEGKEFLMDSPEFQNLIYEFSTRRPKGENIFEIESFNSWLKKCEIHFELSKSGNFVKIENILIREMLDIFEKYKGRKLFREEINSFRVELKSFHKLSKNRTNYRQSGLQLIKKLIREYSLPYSVESFRGTKIPYRYLHYWEVNHIEEKV